MFKTKTKKVLSKAIAVVFALSMMLTMITVANVNAASSEPLTKYEVKDKNGNILVQYLEYGDRYYWNQECDERPGQVKDFNTSGYKSPNYNLDLELKNAFQWTVSGSVTGSANVNAFGLTGGELAVEVGGSVSGTTETNRKYAITGKNGKWKLMGFKVYNISKYKNCKQLLYVRGKGWTTLKSGYEITAKKPVDFLVKPVWYGW